MADPEEQENEELHDTDAEPLPDRELMSLINANVVIPVNGAVAANVLSEDSIAAADADQDVDTDQKSD